MTSKKPANMGGLIPHLICSPCSEAIEFYQKAFGATVESRLTAPDGQRIMHACLRIDGQPLFLVDDFPEYCGGKSFAPTALGGTTVSIHRYVDDCDAAIEKAVQAGASVKMPPQDMFWGDRYGLISDPFGHEWSLATHLEDLTPEQLNERMELAFQQAPTT